MPNYAIVADRVRELTDLEDHHLQSAQVLLTDYYRAIMTSKDVRHESWMGLIAAQLQRAADAYHAKQEYIRENT